MPDDRPGPAAPMGAPLFVLAGAVLWGTTGTAQAFAPDGVPPAVVGAARIGIGAIGLLGVAWATSALPSAATWRSTPARWALLAGAGAIALYQVSFFAGVDRAGVALGTVVAIGSAPAFTGIGGWLVRRERPDPGWLPATLLAVVGCTLLLVPGGGVRPDPVGLGLALAAGACFGGGTLAMKALLDRGVPSTGVVATIFSGGALLLAPVLLTADLGWMISPRGTVTALYLGLAATTAAYVLFSRGLQGVASASAATLALAEPLTAAMLGLVLLAERPGPLGFVGGGLVLTGLLVLSLATRRAQPSARAAP